LGVSYFIYEIVPKTPTLSLMPYWAYALLINDFWSCRYLTLGKISVLWSLAIEEKFYLVTPLLIRFVEKKGQFAVVILALMASVGRQMSLQDQFQFAPPIELSVFRWEGLCLGLLIAMYFFYEGKTLLNQRIAKIAFPVGFFVATALCLVDFPSVIWKGTYFLRFSIGFSFLLLTVLSYQGFKFTAVLRNRMMIWLGTISYGVYLFHPLVRFLVSQLKWGESLGPKAVMIAGTLISAHFSWFYFEKWAVSKGHQKFTY
jgi:peptidoglycan/LPS O-acetylase OafA/YrhL